jgi:hypothetical protein
LSTLNRTWLWKQEEQMEWSHVEIRVDNSEFLQIAHVDIFN